MNTPEQPGKSPIMKWIGAHLDYPHDEYCLIWPFGKRSGYGLLTIEGQTHSAHRYICELVHGPAPSPDHVAAHSCGRGEDACVNPRHIRWKTRAENQQERRPGEGKGRKRTKLTPEAVLNIRSVATLEPLQVTADRHGVSIVTIRNVQSGKTWKGDDRRRKADLTVDEVRSIRQRKDVLTQEAIAAELGISRSIVWRVLNGKAYTFVKDEAA